MAQPNTTLYINNLNDKINKEELRIQLHALFNTHGRIIDVVATKTPKMRGQAFLVFADLAGATSALRACEGMTFYDKPMVRATPIFGYQVIEHCRRSQRISYAKTKSYATLRKDDPNFIEPNSVHAGSVNDLGSKFANGVTLSEKRPREDDTMAGRESKREKADESDEEMEIEEDS